MARTASSPGSASGSLPHRTHAWLHGIFLVSGVAALIVETVWLRWLRLLLGATAPATSATLVAFLLGHAAGAALAARALPRWRRPLRNYALLELAAAGGALAVPVLLGLGEHASGGIYDSLRERPGALTLLRFALALAATFPASLAAGATLATLGAAVVPRLAELGRGGASLYAAHTLGAALGTALAAFVLLGAIGVHATYALGVAGSTFAGLAALALARGERPRALPRALPRSPSAPLPTALLGLVAFSGFGSFAAQVLLVQAFAQVLDQSVYAFGAVLVGVLLSLALGAAGVAWLERRTAVEPRTLLGAALAAAALGLAAFPAWLHALTDGLQYVGAQGAWPAHLVRAQALVLTSAGPALLAAAWVLPLCFALAARRSAPERAPAGGTAAGVHLGRLLAANTLGAVAGALAAPYLLLPRLGLWRSFLALGCAYAGVALATPEPSGLRRALRGAALVVGLGIVLAGPSPLALAPVRLEPGESLVALRTSAAGVVAVVERDGERLIRTDNHYALGGTGERVHQERQAHLCLLLHSRPERVAYVGSATGISAGAALAHADVQRLHLVELVPEVASVASTHFHDANRGVHDDPRTRVVLDDARNFLRSTRERFDVVVSDLFVPWRAGTGALYAREHLEAVRSHLAPDGLLCQWLPLYQLTEAELMTIAATFLDVFPETSLWRGDFYGRFPIAALVGQRGQGASPAQVAAATRALAARGERDRWMTDADAFWALYVGPLGPLAVALRGQPRQTDDRPWIEFQAARSHAGGARGKLEPVVGLRWTRFTDAVRRAARVAGRELPPGLPAEARRAVAGGAELQRAGALWVARAAPAGARALEDASGLLPARILADAPADPSAAEVWRAEP